MKVFIKELVGFDDLKGFYNDGSKMLYCDNARIFRTFDKNSDVYKKLLEVEKETNSYVVEFYGNYVSHIMRKHDVFMGNDYVFPLDSYIELDDNRIIILWFSFDNECEFAISKSVKEYFDDLKKEYEYCLENDSDYSDAEYKLKNLWNIFFKENIIENYNSFERTFNERITDSRIISKMANENILDLSTYPNVYGMIYELPKVEVEEKPISVNINDINKKYLTNFDEFKVTKN